MKQKIHEKLESIKLRKQGKSIAEIASILGVAKSSVSMWVRNTPLSVTARKIILKKKTDGQLAGGQIRHKQVQIQEQQYNTNAIKRLSTLELNAVHKILLCSLIYWCEGAKDANIVAFTNSDPNLVKLFLQLFRSSFVLDESKFRICVHIHTYHDVKKQIKYWSNITNVTPEQFLKPYQKANSGRQTRKDYQGCVSIRYYDTKIARQLLETAKASFSILN